MFERNLKYYRLKAGQTKKALASMCGITPMSITHYEKGDRRPDMETVKKLAEALGVRVSDFLVARNSNLEFNHGEFRKTTALNTASQEYICEFVEDYCSRFFNAVDCIGGSPLPEPPRCHSLKVTGDIETDATVLREELDFASSGPVSELVAVLENKGIIVIEMDIKNDNFSGMNGTVNNYPYIVINKNMTPERKRSTIVHELVHMMFEHADEESYGELGEEKYATAVSGAFLISHRDLERELGLTRHRITNDMIQTCKEYGISMMLLVTRANQTGIVSSSVAKDFYIRAGQAGWRKNEPSRIEHPEEPTLFRQLVYRAVNEEGLSIQKGAELLNIPYADMSYSCGLMEV